MFFQPSWHLIFESVRPWLNWDRPKMAGLRDCGSIFTILRGLILIIIICYLNGLRSFFLSRFHSWMWIMLWHNVPRLARQWCWMAFSRRSSNWCARAMYESIICVHKLFKSDANGSSNVFFLLVYFFLIWLLWFYVNIVPNVKSVGQRNESSQIRQLIA